MDFKELTKDDEITNLIPDIENALRDTPEKTLACMGLAIHQVNLANVLNRFSEGPMCRLKVTVVLCLYQFSSGTDDTAPESTHRIASR